MAICLITAVPKSGSSLLADCLGIIRMVAEQKLEAYRCYPAWWKMKRGHDWDLRPGVGLSSNWNTEGKEPTIYKSHFWPTGKNLAILDTEEDLRYIILLRAPKDQIAAEYCSALRQAEDNSYNPIYPIDSRFFDANDVPAGIAHLINDGYLLHLMLWMARWLNFRHVDRSLVVTYESLIESPLETLKRIAALWGYEISDDKIVRIFRKTSTRQNRRVQGTDKQSIYPCGWSGKVNTWRQYMNQEISDLFDRQYRRYLEIIPNAQLIEDIYPGGVYAEVE